jgi:ribosomal protection tetracycline resistance protein
MRALQRLRVPTIVFVNKVDRAGAGVDRVLEAVSGSLTPAIVLMCAVHAPGSAAASPRPHGEGDGEFRLRLVEVLAERNDALMAAWVEDESRLSYRELRDELAAQTQRALVHPVFFGSARTGAGVELLLAGIAELLPSSPGDPDGPPSGTVFKIERGPSAEKIAFVRMFSGTIRTRDRVRFGRGLEDKVTAIEVFERGESVQRPSVSAGAVARLWGLGEIRVGDRIGEPGTVSPGRQFPPPTLEAGVSVREHRDRPLLHAALTQLAEQDPLIGVRQDEVGELSVSLYGEVQQEVIQATLARDYGLEAAFRETTPIHVERPLRTGEAAEALNAETNPFSAAVGLRVEPAPPGSGLEFRLAVPARTVPLYAYGKLEHFRDDMSRHVRATLQEGLHGWEVTDCVVTMTGCGYASADGPPSSRGPMSTPGDYRKLTPLVLMQALERAGTVVCEPMLRVGVELPTGAIGAVLPVLARLGAAVETPSTRGRLSTVETVLPAARAQELQRRIPALTGGEGVVQTTFAGYRPVAGSPPTRGRSRPNPLNRGDYLAQLAGLRGAAAAAPRAEGVVTRPRRRSRRSGSGSR